MTNCQGPCLKQCTSGGLGMLVIMFMLGYIIGYKYNKKKYLRSNSL